jgi:hypothetical protein
MTLIADVQIPKESIASFFLFAGIALNLLFIHAIS